MFTVTFQHFLNCSSINFRARLCSGLGSFRSVRRNDGTPRPFRALVSRRQIRVGTNETRAYDSDLTASLAGTGDPDSRTNTEKTTNLRTKLPLVRKQSETFLSRFTSFRWPLFRTRYLVNLILSTLTREVARRDWKTSSDVRFVYKEIAVQPKKSAQ